MVALLLLQAAVLPAAKDPMNRFPTRWCALAVVASGTLAAMVALPARAAEGFQVRYNLAGTLGGEIFAVPDQHGVAASLVLTESEIRKVTGPGGQPLVRTVPGGAVALPPPAPAAAYPTYGPSPVTVDVTARESRWNLLLAHISRERHAGGRVALGLNLPYVGRRSQAGLVAGATPALQWNPLVPVADSSRQATEAQFDGAYQTALAQQAATANGAASGFGDLELQAAWIRADPRLRLAAGASLVLPTGAYDPAATPDTSLGKFYTLRPVTQVTWRPVPDVALASRLTVGINSRNRDTQVRSGNWLSLEAAAGYRLRLAVVGLHALRVQQVQDDSGNPWGASRLRTTNAGVFATTRLPGLDTAMTLQYMASIDSQNSQHGRFLQLRLSHMF